MFSSNACCFRKGQLKQSNNREGNQDIDIAHRIPTRIATSGPRPIVSKFIRRIVKEQVMNARNEACKWSANAIGLPSSCSLENVRLFDHLTPLLQQLLADSRNFKREMASSSAGPRTLLFIFHEPKILARSKSSATTTL